MAVGRGDPRPVPGRRIVPRDLGRPRSRRTSSGSTTTCTVPHPVSPMFFDIGGWWLSCDHMFRRFGTPFAVDWLAKNVNGYVYTTAIPADPDLRIDATEYSARYGARVPRDATFAATMGAYLDTVLPVYGRDFADWWRDRLRPGDGAQLRLPRGAPRRGRRHGPGRRGLPARGRDRHPRPPLEDPLDAQLRPAVGDAQPAGGHGEDPRQRSTRQLLGRLQNSASDRNWDSIEALWRMKNEVRDDAELRAAFASDDAAEIAAALRADRARPAVHRRADRAVPARVRLARRLEPRVHLPDGPRADGAGPRARPRLPRRPTTTSRPRSRRCAATSRPPSREILDGLTGDALEEMRAANAVNLRMAPLTPDHHFYIDQGANAHLRLVLHRGRPASSSRPAGSTSPTTCMFLRYNELRGLIGSADGDRRPGDRRDAAGGARGGRRGSTRATGSGTVTPSQLAFPYLVNWGYPDRFHQHAVGRPAADHRARRVAGRRRGHRPGRPHGRRVRRGPRRRHPRLPDDQPGLGRPLHEDRRARHRHRRNDLAPGGPRPRVRDPGGHRHVGRDPADRRPATGSGSTGRPDGSRSCAARPARPARPPASPRSGR